ncbi:MAG TPA: formate--tetrahydrofolate ligase [Gammaproteobacteria bacterium]|nr:formate--tetrahydrofolate ligase [Gammaproteobacteria bacterium]
MSDITIAQQAVMQPISHIAKDKLNLDVTDMTLLGEYKAKLSLDIVNASARTPGKLILVTAISPTPAGEGKTTTTIGLTDALNRLNKQATVCIREPSMGPCFGMKGGAAGGGYAQVVPMEEINLHFTGDLHAISAAHNLLSALIDNHIYQGNKLKLDPNNITWGRVLDMNDRALRDIEVGLSAEHKGQSRRDHFDIVVASEVMAIFCLVNSLQELKQRLSDILIGYSYDGTPRYVKDLQAQGAMTALLKTALQPNLVQTLEHNPAFVHGGPFANIAHGCNSVIATKTALQLSDYVVTEAGFGADLGAEKFINIKCRQAGIKPDVAVLVATIKALKYHGGVPLTAITEPNEQALRQGLANLERHIDNLQVLFQLPCVVAINHFNGDSEQELSLVIQAVEKKGAKAIVAKHWQSGGLGAEQLARMVLEQIDNPSQSCRLLYPDTLPLWGKIQLLAKQLYKATTVSASAEVKQKIAALAQYYDDLPVCMAKTPYSFSSDPSLAGAPSEHELVVRDVRLSRGARFVVVLCGDIMTMPGLPQHPASEAIDIDEQGNIIGLF